MVLSISKRLKKEIQSLASKFSYNLLYLSVDIFSAYTTVQQLFKIPSKQDILIWKIDKNNFHYFTYYENNELSSFMSFRLSKKSYKIYQKIGLNNKNDILIDFIEKVIVKKKSTNNISNVFVYQNNDVVYKKYHMTEIIRDENQRIR